jgi:hypothetical protein
VPHFTPDDRRLLEALRFDPDATPAFEAIKGCLVWPDETPDGISPEGYERLSDLWVARSMLHQGRRDADLPAGLRTAWQVAHTEVASWPGFGRVDLSDADRDYLQAQLRELEESEDGI